MELNIHQVPPTTYQTLKMIFPDLENKSLEKLFVLVSWQKTNNDMTGFTEVVEHERDVLTKQFLTFAEPICKSFKEKGIWSDFIDPSSGLPYLGTRGSTIYIETDDMVTLLGYKLVELGCCRSLFHNEWKTKCFMGVAFFLGIDVADLIRSISY
eukprot:TRINITY_DN12020_c0_g1_i1.p1 TRINITY_DN12020_c0_g1~~TRINITY_DN12020_c0_g1_i1.p1  ORF type:complete len:167 (+),score=19.96 TRINITY_DN12020_c0_g1_i1:40-501(+)